MQPEILKVTPLVQSAIQPVIQVQQLSKRFSYITERPTTLKTAFVDYIRGRRSFTNRTEIQVLEDVSFDIHEGEFVGIMGRNGAGKSTMLKLLCGIYKPTTGHIRVNGKIAPLIELGAGFHNELSGYENIFLNGAILGYKRGAIQELVPKIIEFSELGEKIYMPLKHYSTGMLVRLGFSVASFLEGSVLLIDEVLAVGDAGFQEKCISRIHQLHKQGRTIVVVTHDAGVVAQHCERCIVIDGRRKIFDGPAKQGAAVYLQKFQ